MRARILVVALALCVPAVAWAQFSPSEIATLQILAEAFQNSTSDGGVGIDLRFDGGRLHVRSGLGAQELCDGNSRGVVFIGYGASEAPVPTLEGCNGIIVGRYNATIGAETHSFLQVGQHNQCGREVPGPWGPTQIAEYCTNIGYGQTAAGWYPGNFGSTGGLATGDYSSNHGGRNPIATGYACSNHGGTGTTCTNNYGSTHGGDSTLVESESGTALGGVGNRITAGATGATLEGGAFRTLGAVLGNPTD